MDTLDTTNVESINRRPAVIVSPNSYYLEPRVKRVEDEMDEATRLYEKVTKQIVEVKNSVAKNTQNITNNTTNITNLTTRLNTVNNSLEGLTDRVETLEDSNRSIASQLQETSASANQALTRANTLDQTVTSLSALVAQNAQDIREISDMLVPASEEEILAVCV